MMTNITLSAVERKKGARLHIDAETSKLVFESMSVDGEFFKVTESRVSDAGRRRTSRTPDKWSGVSSIKGAGVLKGNQLVLSPSAWKYRVIDEETGEMVETEKWEPRNEEEQKRLRGIAKNSQPETGNVPIETSSPTTRTKANKAVYDAVMFRTSIAAADSCERCLEKAREFHDNGRPILIHHHMLGRKNSDRIETSARICSVCHDPITFKTTNGLRYNKELMEKVTKVETQAFSEEGQNR